MDTSTFSILFITQNGKPNAEGNAPSLREFERWMETIAASGRLLKQSAIGKAIAYAY